MKGKIKIYLPETLYIWFLTTLIVPNIILSLTGKMPVGAAAANILLPLGIVGLLASWSPKIGRTVWLLFPLIFLAAFQLVIMFIYGTGVIGVDMFLNLVTTSTSEACELLGSLGPAIAAVCILYLPSLVLATVMIVRKRKLSAPFLKGSRRFGIVTTVFAVMLLAEGEVSESSVKIKEHVFPVNAIYNAWLAVDREKKQTAYPQTSAKYRFDAITSHPLENDELVVAVIGETSRASEWELAGYGRPTNPRLSKRNDILFFKDAFSESNTTHKAVPMLLCPVNSENFLTDIYSVKSFITAFSEAGFKTAFISNQKPNHSFIEFFGAEADTTVYVGKEETVGPDTEMLPLIKEFIDSAEGKKLIVIHTYGSHFNYRDRYEDTDRHFTPDTFGNAEIAVRPQLVNAFDNSIVATDRLIDSIISMEEEKGGIASLIYASDHGEDIFDKGSSRFLHASPRPTLQQVHVPMLIWLSEDYISKYPHIPANIRNNLKKHVSSSRSYCPTIMELAGIESPRIPIGESLASGNYIEANEVYLNDHNKAVVLNDIIL